MDAAPAVIDCEPKALSSALFALLDVPPPPYRLMAGDPVMV